MLTQDTSPKAVTTAVPEPPIVPERPTSLAEVGLTPDSVAALMLKWLYAGEASGTDLADRIRLPYELLEGIIEHARVERLVEVRSAGGTGTAGYRYGLTDGGRDRVRQYFDACAYVGPAPVPLGQYLAYMGRLSATRFTVNRERVTTAMFPLVLSPQVVDRLGPAIAARRALFLYGSPGNGKSVIGSGIGRVLGGDLYMPHAIDVDGQIIQLLDPVTHVLIQVEEERQLIRPSDSSDQRWARIARPVITVGGELTLDMLDLTFNPSSNFYEAPLQLKANGGVLVIDDFGRQRVPARDLLNRWIVPLEARIDYLTLHTGRKFEIPFDVLIVFATNLEPRSLADEAFLRRIPYKILAQNPTYEQFCRIFAQICNGHGLAFDPAMVEHLHREHYVPRRIEMRGCHPRDLIDQVVNLCRYQNREPEVTTELLDAACRSYFIEDTESTTQGAVS